MKFVRFEDGKYAARKGFLGFYVYRDHSTMTKIYWWPKNSIHIKACLADSLEELKALIEKQDRVFAEFREYRRQITRTEKDKGKVVK